MYITLQRERNLFDMQWNVHRIWVLHLDLPTGVRGLMLAFRNLTTEIYPRLPNPLNSSSHFKIL